MEVALRLLPGVGPAEVLAEDRAALAAARDGRGSLRIATLAGDVISLGRYHVAPPADDGLWRRHSGGRVVAAGDGFVVVSLTLAHRSALASADPFALSPEQVMNRCVRGLLDGLTRVGVSPIYPGRDVVTAGARPLALVSFEVDEWGALLFEAVVAVARDMSVLPVMLDRVDPTGVVTAGLLAPDAVTSIVRETGTAPPFGTIARAVADGYAAKLGVVGLLDPSRPLPGAADVDRWLGARRPRPDLTRRARMPTMLGTLEFHVALDGGRLREVMLVGDVVAPSATIAALEQGLCGCAATRDAIGEVVARIFAEPGAFVLGVGAVGTIVDVLVRACT